jgi:hypothetical protein
MHIRQKQFANILLAMLAILLTAFSQARKPALNTTVCNLAEHSERYAQRLVRVRAVVSSDLVHRSLLVDQACDEVGAALDFTEEDEDSRPIKLVKDQNFRDLQVLHGRLLELRLNDQLVYGTFEGLFEWHEGKIPSRVFVLHRVTNLYVGKLDDPKFALRAEH